MKNSEIKRFMKLLGYQFVTVGIFDTIDETIFQFENEKWMDRVGMDKVGDYFVKIDSYEFIRLDNTHFNQFIDFENDWNWLMKIALKLNISEISTDIKIAFKQCRDIISSKFIKI